MGGYGLNNLKYDLMSGNFYTVYQPIVSSSNIEIIYSEVLTRLKGNSKIRIDRIIKLAEENGLIQDLYDLITNKVGQFLYYYPIQRYGVERLSINVSPYQLIGDAFTMYGKLTTNFYKWRVHPRQIALEITESKEIGNRAEVSKLIKMLRRDGFLIMLDDFGSECSNFNALIDFEFDLLKMDKHIIDKLDSNNNMRKVMYNINALKSSGYEILIEGIDRDNFELAGKLKCDYYQGFLFSKPLMTSDYLRLIRSRNRNRFAYC